MEHIGIDLRSRESQVCIRNKTLKAEAIRPPRAALRPQQRAFNASAPSTTTNGASTPRGATPASHYRASPRLYTGTLPPIEYRGHLIVKRITNAGTFAFWKKLPFIANSLKQHTIGLEAPTASGRSIFRLVLLARLDERNYVIRG